ncbi:3381_t:CDS:2 [Diversispora eburnea]|uniref:3381_t:CDS:1 n=1 Tax=Diversispora eburnea TaxID=1213867 RepID=A0A9N8ZEC1_9GLOM|nr:3381_t:CDS:2 [Diversispora eburnea]
MHIETLIEEKIPVKALINIFLKFNIIRSNYRICPSCCSAECLYEDIIESNIQFGIGLRVVVDGINISLIDEVSRSIDNSKSYKTSFSKNILFDFFSSKTETDSSKSKPDLTQKKIMSLIKKSLSDIQNNKQ